MIRPRRPSSSRHIGNGRILAPRATANSFSRSSVAAIEREWHEGNPAMCATLRE